MGWVDFSSAPAPTPAASDGFGAFGSSNGGGFATSFDVSFDAPAPDINGFGAFTSSPPAAPSSPFAASFGADPFSAAAAPPPAAAMLSMGVMSSAPVASSAPPNA